MYILHCKMKNQFESVVLVNDKKELKTPKFGDQKISFMELASTKPFGKREVW